MTKLEKLQANVATLYSKLEDAYDTMTQADASAAQANEDWVKAHEKHRLADNEWYDLNKSTRGYGRTQNDKATRIANPKD